MSKPQAKDFVIEADEDARAAREYFQARAAFSSLRRLRHSPHRWVPLLKATHPEITPEAALERLNSLIAEARVALAKTQKRATGYLGRQRAPTMARSPVAFATHADQATANCQPESGFAKYPTGAQQYLWLPPTQSNDNSTRGETNWTLVRRQHWWELEPSIDVGLGNSYEADGIAFQASVTHEDSTSALDIGLAVLTGGASLLALGPIWEQALGSTFCLQFTIKAPQCDSVLHWETTAYGLLPSGATIDAEKGKAGIDIVVAEQTPAGSFPPFPSSFRTVATNSTDSSMGRLTVTVNVAGSFDVAAGKQSCIYLGVNCGIFATQGSVCTGECWTSPADRLWHDGLFFTWYSPLNTFSYPVPGLYWSLSPK